MQSQGSAKAYAKHQIRLSLVTYYRWRKEYGGMQVDQLKRLNELEKVNERLCDAVSDLTLDRLILKEADKGNFQDCLCGRTRPAKPGSSAANVSNADNV